MGLSCVAIVINFSQNRLNKKQNLFDRRLKIYIKSLELIDLYETCKKSLDKLNPLDVKMQFETLTNNSRLYKIKSSIADFGNAEIHNAFLLECELLEKDALELEMIYKNRKYKQMSKFILKYKEVLVGLYKQQRYVTTRQEGEKCIPRTNEERHEAQQRYQDECKQFMEKQLLYYKVVELEASYNEIKEDNILVKMKKDIQF